MQVFELVIDSICELLVTGFKVSQNFAKNLLKIKSVSAVAVFAISVLIVLYFLATLLGGIYFFYLYWKIIAGIIISVSLYFYLKNLYK